VRPRLSRRVLTVLFLAAIAAVAARIAAPAPNRPAGHSAALSCGVERWQIKTLQDRPRLLRARPSTVANLVSLQRPSQIPFASRLPTEQRIFSVVAAVTLVRQEADQDLHLVLESGSDHMIAEAPLTPTCTQNATSYRKKQMARARAAVQLCSEARVVGVAFWDFKHHQTGVAPNAIELHPILGFACL
jgi:hypothetical protein